MRSKFSESVNMSRMKIDRKPPLAKCPIQIQPRRSSLIPNSTSLQTPPGSLRKSLKPSRLCDRKEPENNPEYHTISRELRALANMVRTELGSTVPTNASQYAENSSMFERGRFYEEYSTRRNERLKRKKGETMKEDKMSASCNLGVTVESSKKRESKKQESLRKSLSAAYSVEKTSEAPRYMLRSMSKENKKPPLPVFAGLGSERKMGSVLRTRKL